MGSGVHTYIATAWVTIACNCNVWQNVKFLITIFFLKWVCQCMFTYARHMTITFNTKCIILHVKSSPPYKLVLYCMFDHVWPWYAPVTFRGFLHMHSIRQIYFICITVWDRVSSHKASRHTSLPNFQNIFLLPNFPSGHFGFIPNNLQFLRCKTDRYFFFFWDFGFDCIVNPFAFSSYP